MVKSVSSVRSQVPLLSISNLTNVAMESLAFSVTVSSGLTVVSEA